MRKKTSLLKIFWSIVIDELKEAKLTDIIAGIIGFLVSALFWWFIFGSR